MRLEKIRFNSAETTSHITQIPAYLSAPKSNHPDMHLILIHSKSKLLISADENWASEVTPLSMNNLNIHVNLKTLPAVAHSRFDPALQTNDHDAQINVVPFD